MMEDRVGRCQSEILSRNFTLLLQFDKSSGNPDAVGNSQHSYSFLTWLVVSALTGRAKVKALIREGNGSFVEKGQWHVASDWNYKCKVNVFTFNNSAYSFCLLPSFCGWYHILVSSAAASLIFLRRPIAEQAKRQKIKTYVPPTFPETHIFRYTFCCTLIRRCSFVCQCSLTNYISGRWEEFNLATLAWLSWGSIGVVLYLYRVFCVAAYRTQKHNFLRFFLISFGKIVFGDCIFLLLKIWKTSDKRLIRRVSQLSSSIFTPARPLTSKLIILLNPYTSLDSDSFRDLVSLLDSDTFAALLLLHHYLIIF
jgi:hypothetical protein